MKKKTNKSIILTISVMLFLFSTALLLKLNQKSEYKNTPETQNAEEVISNFLALIDCTHIDQYYDDIYFYDSMRGIECYQANDSITVRVYSQADSVYQNLKDYEPILKAQRPAVTGSNWFMIGPAEEMAKISNKLPNTSALTTKIPTPKPLTPLQEELTMCIRFVSSAMLDYAFHPEKYQQQIAGYDQHYPGFKNRIETALSAQDIVNIQQLNMEDTTKPMAYISTKSLDNKTFCSNTLKNGK